MVICLEKSENIQIVITRMVKHYEILWRALIFFNACIHISYSKYVSIYYLVENRFLVDNNYATKIWWLFITICWRLYVCPLLERQTVDYIFTWKAFDVITLLMHFIHDINNMIMVMLMIITMITMIIWLKYINFTHVKGFFFF